MSNPPIFTSQQPDQTFHFDQNIPFSIPPLTTTDGLTYQPLEFYYDTQQLNPFNNTDTTDNTFQLTTTPSVEQTGELLKSAAENSNNPNYVQSLETDLQNTRNLLAQYKKRTEQLMELVKKQTTKINELREQLNSKP